MRLKNLYSVESTQRIEAFSDGVFAIAITLLVLEFKVPQVAGQGVGLGRALFDLWPSYFAYVFSFVMIGIYWVNHHYIFQLYKRSDHVFALLNVFFLMCISFLPFPTAVLAQNMKDPLQCQAGVSFYALGLALPALAWLWVWLYASHDFRLIDRKLSPEFVAGLGRQYKMSFVVYLVALTCSFWSPAVALVICVGLTLLYLLPSKRPEYTDKN